MWPTLKAFVHKVIAERCCAHLTRASLYFHWLAAFQMSRLYKEAKTVKVISSAA